MIANAERAEKMRGWCRSGGGASSGRGSLATRCVREQSEASQFEAENDSENLAYQAMHFDEFGDKLLGLSALVKRSGSGRGSNDAR